MNTVDEDAQTLTNGRVFLYADDCSYVTREFVDSLEPRAPKHEAAKTLVRTFPWWFRFLPRFARKALAPWCLKN